MPAARKDRTRVVLVDANAALRAGLRALIESRDDLDVVEAAPDVGALAAIARKRSVIAVVCVDDGDGLELLARLHRLAGPDSRLLVVTASRDPALHYDLLCRGAVGIVPKDQVPEAFLAAVACLQAGGAWLDGDMVCHALERRDIADMSRAADLLTQREREIAVLASRGLHNSRIAERLFLSEGTVRNHLTVIFRKLGVNDRYELIARWASKS